MYGCNKLYCEHLGRYYSSYYRQLAADRSQNTIDFRCLRFPGLISAVTIPTGGTSDYGPEMLHHAAQGLHYDCFVRPDTRLPFMVMPDAIKSILNLEAAPAEALSQRYLVYALSTITARSLPDVRDGLKPVHRRLLWAMRLLRLDPAAAYKKCARVVGDVIGKYHPHGDAAVYESMARMAQDFSERYLLVDGQGNFGSVDGDPPAAMRYTEVRMTRLAEELLADIDKDTVNFVPNYDESLLMPEVLPAKFPNLLVNGASGIAVGMASNIPPHNLAEVCDALIYLIDHPQATVDDIIKFIPGPDFPTGGIILQEHDQNEIQSAYATGRGKIMLRGRVSIEEAARGKSRIIVSELPYMTNKAALIERIAELSREGQLDAVTDLRDESDRHGMRIVIELKQGAEPEKTLLALYKKTPMQVTFTINLLALVNGEPRLMTLKQALKVFVEHRLEVITRRSQFDLQKAQERLHLLEGLRIALKFLDEVIATIRAARDTD